MRKAPSAFGSQARAPLSDDRLPRTVSPPSADALERATGTFTEIRFLALLQARLPVADAAPYRASEVRRLRCLLRAQYPNGSWPTCNCARTPWAWPAAEPRSVPGCQAHKVSAKPSTSAAGVVTDARPLQP